MIWLDEAADLVGRAAERRALAATLDVVRTGRGAITLIEGEAGIGKTRLVRAAAEAAGAAGFTVLRSGGDELARTIPFAPLLDALDCSFASADPERATVARMVAEAKAATGSILLAVVEGFLGILERSALLGPVALVVEDLHWADQATVVALGWIVRRLRDVPLWVIASTRPTADPDVAAFVATAMRNDAVHLAVAPLPEADVRALVRAVAGGEPGSNLTAMIDGASGNPLYVTELLNALAADGAIALADGRAEITEAAMPATLRLAILRNLEVLSEPARDLVVTASLLGTTFEPADLEVVAGRALSDLEAPLREAARVGVLSPGDGKLAFRHDLVREAIYTDIPEPVRKARHRAAARALEDAGVPLVRVAGHLVRGAEKGDKEAAHRLEAIGNEVFKSDLRAGDELWGAAKALYPDGDPELARFGDPDFDALLAEGRFDDAEAVTRRRMAAALPPDIEALQHATLARIYVLSQRLSEAVAEYERAIAVEASPPYIASALRAQLAAALYSLGDTTRARAVAEEGLRIGEADEDPGSVVIVSAPLAWLCLYEGRIAEGLATLERALALAERLNAPPQPLLQLQRSIFLADADRPDAAEEAFDQAARAGAENVKTDVEQVLFVRAPFFGAVRALMRLPTGDWDDAVAELEASRDGLEGKKDEGKPWPTIGLGIVSLARGDVAGAEDLAAAAFVELGETGATGGTDGALWLQAIVQEAAGNVAAALETLRSTWAVSAKLRTPFVFRFQAPDAVRIALACGDEGFARAVVEDAGAWAQTMDVSSARAAAVRAQGLLDGDPERLLEAVSLYRSAPRRPFETALTQSDAAEALLAAGRTDEARALFDEALGFLGSVGATRLIDRCHATMRAHGIRRGARGARRRPTTGWESLTPTELRIVDAVGEGLRNAEIGARLFISPHTVSTHLRHIFGKLGLSSRVELTKAHGERRAAVGAD